MYNSNIENLLEKDELKIVNVKVEESKSAPGSGIGLDESISTLQDLGLRYVCYSCGSGRSRADGDVVLVPPVEGPRQSALATDIAADFVSPTLLEYVCFPTVEVKKGKRRQQLTEAISSVAFYNYIKEKEEKRKDENRKKLRKEERLRIKHEKEQQLRERKESRDKEEERRRKKMELQQRKETRKADREKERERKNREKAETRHQQKKARIEQNVVEDICCVCQGQYEQEEKWVGCDFCPRWLHFECLDVWGLTDEVIRATTYGCGKCI